MTKELVLQDLKGFGFEATTFPFSEKTLATKQVGYREVSLLISECGVSLFIEVCSLLVETLSCAMRNVSFGNGFMFFHSEIGNKKVKLDLKTLDYKRLRV